MPKDYNRTAAYVEYARGTPLEDISHALAIPLDSLRRWAHEDRWATLAETPRSMTGLESVNQAERGMERIRENRERNYALAQKLQTDLANMLDQLLSGKLRCTKVFANGSRAEVEPSIRDRCDLALYAKNVADMSYRALGDAERPAGDSGGTTGGGAGQITIVLPSPIAAPRDVGPGKVFDIEAEVVSTETQGPEAEPD